MLTDVKNMEDKYYTIEEIAELLKVTYMTVYRWIKSNRLEALKAGKQYRITKRQLDKFLNSSKS